MRTQVLEWMRSPKYRPMTRSELARKLEIPSAARSELRDVLHALVHEGQVVEGKKARYELRGKKGDQLTGTLRFHPKGHAFFYPNTADEQNIATGIDLKKHSRIYVPRREAGTALDGDKVRISVRMPSPKREGKFQKGDRRLGEAPEDDAKGHVEQILERRSGRLVGIFRQKGKHSWVECSDTSLDGPVELHGDTTAQPGQTVVVELEQWDKRDQAPRGRILEVLGWPGDPGVDIVAVIHRHGLRTSFPEAVIDETRNTEETPAPAEIARRSDWRSKLVITIDPADAKDHDDAIWLEKTDKGWTLAVHIADVSHYVKPGTALDKEATERGNSTYLVDRVLPMLPPELSNGICSLKPDVDRLTKCALMEIGPKGEIKKARFMDAVIHSRAKLSYEQAQAILDGKPAPEGSEAGLEEMVREAWRMASALRRRRFANGALDLEMPEIRIKLDDKGRACGVIPVEHTSSHQLIEECMLAANEAVARVLKVNQKPAVHRIHEDPDFSKLFEFGETAKLHGYKPGDLSNREHIQKLLDDSKGSPEEHAIKLGLLKSLKRAAYSPDAIGHYGLAKADYCHFTSPIRRYADLIVHRALQPFLDNAPKNPDRTPPQGELREISRHISDTERVSADAESETKQLKMMEFLGRVADLEDPIVFDGLVTDVRPMGLLVEVPDIGIRGAVKREDLPGGRWRFEGHRSAWTNWEGQSIALGMRLPLEVTGVDRVRRFVDFRIAVGTEGAAGSHGSFNQPEMPVRKKKTPPKDTRPPKPAKASKPAKDGKRPAPDEESKPPGWKPFSKAKSGGKKKHAQKKNRK
ncbi:MAG: ribonuclease R [Luteolibacter sp.]